MSGLAFTVSGPPRGKGRPRATSRGGFVRVFTDAERGAIVRYYKETSKEVFDLTVLSKELNRPRTSVCRVARSLGLTDMRRPLNNTRKAKVSLMRKTALKEHGHPRGMFGKVHTEETKRTIGVRSRAAWEVALKTRTGLMDPKTCQLRSNNMMKQMSSRTAENSYSRAKGGRRIDLNNSYFRSAWEANYARYLNWLLQRGEIDEWKYEPETFWFEKIKRGTRSYTPDFRIVEHGRVHFVEIKGWMDAKSKTKLQRMRKYFPDTEIRILGEADYRRLKAGVGGLIPCWE